MALRFIQVKPIQPHRHTAHVVVSGEHRRDTGTDFYICLFQNLLPLVSLAEKTTTTKARRVVNALSWPDDTGGRATGWK